MSNHPRYAAFFVPLLAVVSCSQSLSSPERAQGQAEALSLPAVRISEIHYDNAGADVGEAIEISGPAGFDVSGYQVVLYNGNGGASYGTRALSGTIPATCGARGVVVLSYPANGIQNGGTTATGTTDADGVALLDASGALVQFLSYEGVFAATNGPAAGVTSTDIGVRELGTEAVGASLQLSGNGAWSGPVPNTFGACNDADQSQQPAEVASVTVSPATAALTPGGSQLLTAAAFDATNQPVTGVTFTWSSSAPAVASVDASGLVSGLTEGDAAITVSAPNGVAASSTVHVAAVIVPTTPAVHFSEIHYDNVGTDVNEAVEIEGPVGTDVTGFSVVLYDGNGGVPYNTQTLSGALPATCADRGVLVLNYPQNGLQNGSPDGLALVDAGGHVVEFLSYEGVFAASTGPAAGLTSTDIGAAEATSAPIGQSLQRDASGAWQVATATFGACNGNGGTTQPPGNHISFTGRTASDVPLPVGFQDQLFASVRDANNVAVQTTVTWSSDTPDLASIDSNGVMTAIAVGTAVLRATTADGTTTATVSLPTTIAVASTTAQYLNNAEFGEPTDSDPSDDFIVHHPEFTASYNQNRGTANWVSYDLNASDFGAQDRCDCFTFDPDLPANFARYTTADYTGAGAFAGYGIDRGHLTRSFDRTSASLDNAFTFLFTNVVPQASDLNQGPWAILENDLGDLARLQNKEVYITAGVAGSKGTLKNEGKITIPASTWKVAVILPRGRGVADVVDYRDLSVIAVNMPNEPGVRNVPWQTYQTTVSAIETLTGYDLLARLPDKIENAVSNNLQPPFAALDGPYASLEGSAVGMSAAASLDPNGSIVGYQWSFGDGSTATGAVVSHVYTQDGNYPVTVTVTDNDGLTDTVVSTVTVANVAPILAPIPAAALIVGETYQAASSFSDPGADPWSASVDYGDGSAASPLVLSGQAFSVSHRYTVAGTFTVTVNVSDDHALSSASQTVSVLSRAQAISGAIALIDGLSSTGKLNRALAFVFKLELTLAGKALDHGDRLGALLLLRAVNHELEPIGPDAAPARAFIARLIATLQ